MLLNKILSFFLFHEALTQTFTLPFTFSMNSIRLSLNLGSNKRIFLPRVNQRENFNVMVDRSYQPLNSVTSINHGPEPVEIDGLIFSMQLIEDILQIKNDIVLPGFQFLFLNSSSLTKLTNYQTLGFGPNFEKKKEQHSLTHLLYHRNYIKNKSYTIAALTNSYNGGNIYFGEVPKNETEGMIESKCSQNDDSKNWECELSSAYFYNVSYGKGDHSYYSYDKKGRVIFDASQEYIYAPLGFIKLLNDTFFKSKIRNEECYYKASMGDKKYHTFICDCMLEYEFFDNLTFQIGSGKFSLDRMFLFTLYSFDESSPCMFIITENDDSEDWIMGGPFFKRIKVKFDYDNREIVFYSIKPYEPHRRGIVFTLIAIASIILSISSIILSFLIYKAKIV